MDEDKKPAKIAFDVEFTADEEDIMLVALKLDRAVRKTLAKLYKDSTISEPRIIVASHVEV